MSKWAKAFQQMLRALLLESGVARSCSRRGQAEAAPPKPKADIAQLLHRPSEQPRGKTEAAPSKPKVAKAPAVGKKQLRCVNKQPTRFETHQKLA